MFNLNLKAVEVNTTVRADGKVETTYSLSFADGSFGRTFKDGEIRFSQTIR